MLGELSDGFLEPFQSETDCFYFIRGERSCLHSSDRLTFHELSKELDKTENQLHHRTLHILGIGVPPKRAARRDIRGKSG